jgi:hypothetical protein
MQSISSLTTGAWQLYKENFKTLFLILLVPAVLSGIAGFFEPFPNQVQSTAEASVYFFFLVSSLVISIAMTIALVHKLDDTSLDAKSAYQKGWQQLLKYIGFSIVLTIVLLVAFILLIIPGIWLSVSFTFAIFFLLLKGASIIDSLKMSFNLVKGKWWGVLGQLLVLGLLCLLFVIGLNMVSSVIGALVGEDGAYAFTSAVSYFLAPYSMGYMYLLFKSMEQKQGGEDLQ